MTGDEIQMEGAMRRWLGAATVMAVVAQTIGLWLFGGTAAKAEAWEDLTTLTADTSPTWQTNGVAWVIKAVGNVVYVGGTFTRVRPPGVAAGGAGEVTRTNFAAFDAATGDLLPCAPAFTLNGNNGGAVRAIEGSVDGSRVYVGGSFGSVRIGSTATSVANLISLDTSSCTLTASASFRRPAVSGQVQAISAASTGVYFGGEFTTVDSLTRQRLAAVSTNGTLSSFSATIDRTVWAIIAAPEYNKIVVGGQFTAVNGVTGANARSLIALNPTTGATVQNFSSWAIPTNSVNHVLLRDGDRFYIGNEGSGGGVFDGRAAGLLSTGAMLWKDTCLGATQSLAVLNGVLYSGSHAHDCSSTPGGYPDGKRQHLLAQSAEDRTIVPWFPNTDGGIGEQLGPRSMTIGAGQLWVAGEFTAVNGVAQQGITRFAASPDTEIVFPPLLAATSNLAGKITVSWTAGWDEDDGKITYELYRTGTTAPIYVKTVASREWDRPRMSFTDDVGAGVTASYSIRTSDGTNVSPKGAIVTATAATSSVPYVGSVSTDAPKTWWRLDETTGTTAADSSGADHPGVYANVTRGATTALASGNGNAATFNGSSSRVNTTSDVKISFVKDFSVEIWFKTTTNRGGRMIGYGNNRTSNSSSYDRMLYMSNAGNVEFGVYTTTTNVLKSPATYRDGTWHHAVGTKGPMGMRLYVDGKLVGSNAVSGQQAYYGYWNAGGDNLANWPDRPTSNYFAGDLDEATFYDKPVAPARVFEHFAEGKPTGYTDTADPTTPGQPTLTSTSAKVTASWTASTDDLLVAGYQVHRSQTTGFVPDAGTLVGTTDWPTFEESSVPPGTWYYKIIAVDAVGKLSAASAQRAVTIVDNQAPTTPGSPDATAYDDEVDLTWTASDDDTAVVAYDVHRLSTSGGTPSTSTLVGTTLGTSFTDVAVPGGDWFYRVIARDAAGNSSAASAAATATTRTVVSNLDFEGTDTLAPTPTFSAAHATTSTIAGATLVRWDDPRLTFRGATGFTTGPAYPDTMFVQPSSRYPGARGSQPVYGVDFTTDAAQFEIYTKYLSAAGQTIQVKVDGHRTTQTPRLVGGTTLGSPLVYKVDFGSAATRRITIETSTNPFGGVFIPPGASLTKSPAYTTKFIAVGDSITGGSAQNVGGAAGTWLLRTADYLGWDDPWNEAIGATGYITPGAAVTIPNRIVNDAVQYKPQRLLLWAGYNDNQGSQTAIRSAVDATLAAIKDGSPVTRTYVAGVYSARSVTSGGSVNTDATLRQAAAAAHVPFFSPITGRVYGSDGSLLARQRPWITGSGNITNPAGDGNADLYIGADGIHPTDVGHVYLARRMAQALEQIALTEPPFDTQAPSTPGSVTGTATGQSVDVDWAASTDNVEVTRYSVHRGNSAAFTPSDANRVRYVTATDTVETSVPVGTWYYKVLAEDSSGNLSTAGVSPAVVVSVADSTAPSAPTEVNTSVSGSEVTVTWTASTDNVGVAGYDVHRGASSGFTPSTGNRVAQVSTTSAVDTGVLGGTWYYKVVARDGNNNLSAPSEAASAVVAPPPPQEISLTPTADTYLNSAAAATNFGTSSSMIVGGGPSLDGLLRFNLPAPPLGLALTSVKLAVHSTTSTFATSTQPIQVRLSGDNWDESTVTWNTRPTYGSTVLGTLSSIDTLNTTYMITLDAAQFSGLTGSTSLAMTMSGADETQLYTRTFGGVSYRPALVLGYS